MPVSQHLFYYADKKLKTEFQTLYAGISDFMQLATPATQAPVHASVRRYGSPPQPSIYSKIPLEEREAWLNQGATQNDVDTLVHDGLEVAGDPDVGVHIRWSPNIAWDGRTSFDYLDLSESHHHEGYEYTHFIGLGTAEGNPTCSAWGIIYIAVPFDGLSSEFFEFLNEAETRLPFKLGKPGWRHITPAKEGKKTKMRKLIWPDL